MSNPTVYLSGPNNSTMFTTCCEVAITGACCPRCLQEVLPLGDVSRWSAAYGPIRRGTRVYGNPRPSDKRTPIALAALARVGVA